MQLTSVNIGRARTISHAKSSWETGIYKLPAGEPVRITYQGVLDDTICDTESHGGVDQAVYIYGAADYAWWSTALGYDLAPGTFGDNLTIADLESATYSIGDRFQISDVTLEVTAPRIPCVTLATRMGDPAFVKRFRRAERPGLYCRVVQEGVVTVGDAVVCERYSGVTVTALEMFRDGFVSELSEAAIRRYLAAPIAIRNREYLEEELQKL